MAFVGVIKSCRKLSLKLIRVVVNVSTNIFGYTHFWPTYTVCEFKSLYISFGGKLANYLPVHLQFWYSDVVSVYKIAKFLEVLHS